MEEHLEVNLRKLIKITENCRPDMHEPDEQGLSARVVGNHLDNAMGDDISPSAISGQYQEYVVILEKMTDGHTVFENINLATLIALARRAVI